MRTDKESLVRGYGLPVDEALRLEAACFNRLIGSPEMADGIRRFRDRDHPDLRRPAKD
jgi:enoyl-CoA hydratase